MSTAILGTLVTALLALTTLLGFATMISASGGRVLALVDAGPAWRLIHGSSVDITSVSASTAGGATTLTLQVDNPGRTAVYPLSRVDVMVSYTDSTGSAVAVRPTYTSGTPGDNEWSGSLSPDAFNPDIWDPDETLTVTVRLVPEAGAGTTGTVTVALPGGATDSETFTN